MAHRYGLPIRVQLDHDGVPIAFTWRGLTHDGTVISTWHLSDRWWDRERQSDRIYYRLLAPDHQVFEIYRDRTSAGLWILDRVLD